MHVMLDLETMGNRPDAPIVAIGACAFDEQGLHGGFYETNHLRYAVESGAVIDPDTVLWWLEQSQEARQDLIKAEGTLNSALCAFRSWLVAVPNLEGVWGNGAAFDNVILAETYRRRGETPPWPFWLDRCYRTMKASVDFAPMRIGIHHNALDDAKTQASHLIKIWQQASAPADLSPATSRDL